MTTQILFKKTNAGERWRREWDSNPCGPEGPRALKARALTTLPSGYPTAVEVLSRRNFPAPIGYFCSYLNKMFARIFLLGYLFQYSLGKLFRLKAK